MLVINGDHDEANSSAECAARVQSRNEGVRRRQVAVQLGGLYVARAEGSMWTLNITKMQRGTGWPPEGVRYKSCKERAGLEPGTTLRSYRRPATDGRLGVRVRRPFPLGDGR